MVVKGFRGIVRLIYGLRWMRMSRLEHRVLYVTSFVVQSFRRQVFGPSSRTILIVDYGHQDRLAMEFRATGVRSFLTNRTDSPSTMTINDGPIPVWHREPRLRGLMIGAGRLRPRRGSPLDRSRKRGDFKNVPVQVSLHALCVCFGRRLPIFPWNFCPVGDAVSDEVSGSEW